MKLRVPKSIRKRFPCSACKPIRERKPLRIAWPIEVRLTMDGPTFHCHRCGRDGPIDRDTIPLM